METTRVQRVTLTVAITPEESAEVERLQAKGFKIVAIFRTGLQKLSEENK